jgi:hypothetical protein
MPHNQEEKDPLVLLATQIHPKIKKKKWIWKLIADSYRGGIDYRKGAYLHQYTTEIEEEYEKRLNRAIYFNHVRPLSEKISGLIHKREIKREIPEALEPFFKSASRGKSMALFMITLAIHSLQQTMGVLVDSPSFDPNEVKLESERQALNLNPFLVLYFPEKIRNFYFDNRGDLQWIILDNSRIDNSDPKAPMTEITEYRLWTKEFYQDFIVTVDNDKIKVIEGKQIPHPLGIVPFRFVNWVDSDENNIEESIMEDVALISQGIYNHISLNDEQITTATFQTLFFPAADVEKDVPIEIKKGGVDSLPVVPYNGALSGVPFFAGASPQSIEPVLTTVKMYTREILKIVGMTDDPPLAGRPKTATEINVDYEKLESMLKLGAEQLQAAELWIFNTADMWMGGKNQDKSSVNYPRQFKAEDIQETIENLWNLYALQFESLREVSLNDIITKTFTDKTNEEIKQIINDLDKDRANVKKVENEITQLTAQAIQSETEVADG